MQHSLILKKESTVVVQPKLTINTPGDQYEQQADAMADRVMRMPSIEAIKPVTGLIGKSLQRKCAHCEEEEKRKKPIMRKAEAGTSVMSVSSSFASSLNSSKGGGSSLPPATRSFMENSFSTDFSQVRIHTDTQAAAMNKGINAKAFTYGNDIYFNSDQYAPDSSEGKHLLAHELTHVVQQDTIQPRKIQRVPIAIAPIVIPIAAILLILKIIALAGLVALGIYAAYIYLMSKIAELITAVETVSNSIEDYIRNNPREGMRCSSELIAFRLAKDNIIEALRNPATFGAILIIRRLQIFKDAANALAACLGLPPIF